MAAPTNRIQLAREQIVFAKKETTKGTINYPVSTDMIVVSGAGAFNQNPSYTDSTEVRDTRSLKDRFVDKMPAGTWNFPMYARPSGTAGSIPDAACLYEAALGDETIGGSDVTYSLLKDLPSLTIAFGLKDVVYWIVGATVNELRMSLSNKGAIQFEPSGGFMEMIFAGASECEDHTSGVVGLKTTGDWMKYKKDAKVKFWDVDTSTWYHNSGAGYTITNVDSATNEITVSPAISEFTLADGDHVFGFLPTGTEVGAPIEARKAVVKFDTVEIPIKSCDFSLVNNVKYEEEEISTAEGPQDYIADRRAVTAATTLWFRGEDLKYFRKALDKTEVAILITGGDTAGKKMDISLPQALGSVPVISGDLEKELAIDFVGIATSTLEDELTIKFY